MKAVVMFAADLGVNKMKQINTIEYWRQQPSDYISQFLHWISNMQVMGKGLQLRKQLMEQVLIERNND